MRSSSPAAERAVTSIRGSRSRAPWSARPATRAVLHRRAARHRARRAADDRVPHELLDLHPLYRAALAELAHRARAVSRVARIGRARARGAAAAGGRHGRLRRRRDAWCTRRAARRPVVLQEQNSFPGPHGPRVQPLAREIYLGFPEAAALLPGARTRSSGVHRQSHRAAADAAAPKGRRARAWNLARRGHGPARVRRQPGSAALNAVIAAWVARGLARRRPADLGDRARRHFDKHAARESERVRVRPYLAPDRRRVRRGRPRAHARRRDDDRGACAWRIPPILVPLPTAAADHQTVNAKALGRGGRGALRSAERAHRRRARRSGPRARRATPAALAAIAAAELERRDLRRLMILRDAYLTPSISTSSRVRVVAIADPRRPRRPLNLNEFSAADMPLLDPSDRRPVHFVGIAGAGMSALAELFVRRGVSGHRMRRDGRSDRRPRAARDRGEHGPRPGARRRRARRRRDLRGAEDASGARARARARHPGHPSRRGARRGRERRRARGDRGHARQDDDDRDDHRGARRRRPRADRRRRRPRRARGAATCASAAIGCSWSRRTSTTGRSSRSRPPSRWSRTSRRTTSTSTRDLDDIHRTFEQFASPARTIVLCADDAGANRLATPSTARGHPLRHSLAATRGSLARDIRTEGGGSLFEVEYDGEMLGEVELCGARAAQRAQRARRDRQRARARRDGRRRCAPGLAAFRGVERRFQRLGDGGRGGRRRRLRASSDRDPRDARGGAHGVSRAAHRRRVPAAPVLAHARLRARVRRGARGRRRRVPRRHLSRARAADAGRDRRR